MSLPFHIFLHIALSFLIGFFIFNIFQGRFLAFLGTFIGGVLVDLDHLIDYFLTFGFRFNLHYFLKGYQFLKSEKIYIFFHAWEYVGLLFITYYLLTIRGKITLAVFVLALALGLGGHLIIDTVVNHIKLQTYSLTYRINNNFEAKYLIYPKYWRYDLQIKKEIRF